ncbi:MAG: DNRLRE domain-containing protein [Chloroflexi bacterium]|nr:DNRLRE domain-containing protein [Chloroflexota bacterium]
MALLWLASASQPLAAQTPPPPNSPPASTEFQRGLQRVAPTREPVVSPLQASATGVVTTVVELPASADSYIATNRPNQNFGTESLFLGYNNNGDQLGAERLLIRFDLANTIPAGATIQDARLQLHLAFSTPITDTPMSTTLRRITGAWNEANVTWNSEPAATDSRAGITIGNATNTYEWALTDWVTGWVSGTFNNQGLELIGDEQAQQHERVFYARETTTDFFPRLIISYTMVADTEPPIVTVDPLPAFVARSFTVAWHGADRGSSGLDHYDVQYRVDGGNWIDWQTKVTTNNAEFPNSQNGRRYDFRARGVDKAGNEEAFGNPEATTTVDTQPPTAQISALPLITHTNTISTAWTSSDNGGSGVQYYDVQYRVNGGPWQLWQQQTTATSVRFMAPDDALYEFEVRAVDNRGLVEEFTNQPEANVLIDAVAPFVEPVAWLPEISTVTTTQ